MDCLLVQLQGMGMQVLGEHLDDKLVVSDDDVDHNFLDNSKN